MCYVGCVGGDVTPPHPVVHRGVKPPYLGGSKGDGSPPMRGLGGNTPKKKLVFFASVFGRLFDTWFSSMVF
jgi:hypothetical protein